MTLVSDHLTSSSPLPDGAAGMIAVSHDMLERLKTRFGDVPALTSFLRRTILDMEDALSDQMSAIIEHPEFKEMEARWTGLASVVWAKRGAPSVKIKLLDLSWNELSRDLHYTSELRQSILYKLMGQRELDTMGGEPFGIAMLDHPLSMSLETEFDDLYTAQLVCELGEAVMCPIIMGLADDFLGEKDAAWLSDARRVSNVLHSDEYRSWQALRNRPNARFLSLVMLKTQLRSHYQDRDIGFRFHQWPSQSDGLWASAAYDFLRTVISEFLRYAWFGFLKLVGSYAGEGAVLAPTEHPIPDGCDRGVRAHIRMTRNLAHIYAEQGFIPLAESPKNNLLYFVGNRSVTNTGGNAASEIVTQLQSVMIACRIVHYLKVQIRALIGQVKTSAECEQILNDWFDPYVSGSSSSNELQARFPLQGARVRISESTTDAARFHCEVVVRPQFQIDNVLGDITLRTDFGAGSAGKAA